MTFFGGMDIATLILIPTVTLRNCSCDYCDTSHGFSISVAWLCFEGGIFFGEGNA